jgi:hypothetical protein
MATQQQQPRRRRKSPKRQDVEDTTSFVEQLSNRRERETRLELATSSNLEWIRNIGDGGVPLDVVAGRDAESVRKGLTAAPIKDVQLSPGILDDAGAGLLLNDRSLLDTMSAVCTLEASFLNVYKCGRARRAAYSEAHVRNAFPQAAQRYVISHEHSYDVEEYGVVVHVFFVEAPLFLYAVFHALGDGRYAWSGHRYIEGVLA